MGCVGRTSSITLVQGVEGPPAACLGRVRAVFNSLPPCRYLPEYAVGFVRLLRNDC